MELRIGDQVVYCGSMASVEDYLNPRIYTVTRIVKDYRGYDNSIGIVFYAILPGYKNERGYWYINSKANGGLPQFRLVETTKETIIKAANNDSEAKKRLFRLVREP